MSRSYWYAGLTILGLLLALQANAGDEKQRQTGEIHDQQQSSALLASTTQRQKRIPYRPDCQRPADKDEYDVCAAAAQASAAIAANQISADGVAWNKGGVILVLLTLAATSWAAWAAQQSADAAMKSIKDSKESAKQEADRFLQQLDTMRQYAEAAKIGAESAAQSVAVSKKMLVASQRAYIYTEDIKAFWEIDPKTKRYFWRFRPIWKNTGNTNTKNLRMHTLCKVTGALLPVGFDFDYETQNIGRGIIHPQMSTLGPMSPAPPSPPISPKDITDAQNARSFIYLMGWMRYMDVLDESVEHITRFCWQIIPVGDPIKKPENIRWDIAYHSEGNCADEECNC